jgi:DNA-directed RNA polymerase subunit E'/Rpb7
MAQKLDLPLYDLHSPDAPPHYLLKKQKQNLMKNKKKKFDKKEKVRERLTTKKSVKVTQLSKQKYALINK